MSSAIDKVALSIEVERRSSDGDSGVSRTKSKVGEDDREEQNDDRIEVLDKNNSHFI